MTGNALALSDKMNKKEIIEPCGYIKTTCYNFLLQQSKLLDVDITYFILIYATLSLSLKGSTIFIACKFK